MIEGIDPREASWVAEKLFHSAIADGHLTSDDLKDPHRAIKKLQTLVKVGDFELTFVIDHRGSLLDLALEYMKATKYELSVLFFATFFEHSINHVIDASLKRKNFGNDVAKGLIRACAIRDKFGWVLELLSLPSFNAAHRKTIERVAEERNQFAHYKWTGFKEPKAADLSLLASAKKAATYARTYESRLIYNGNKTRINKLFPAKSPKSRKPV
ncbi:hypothetical protein LQ772_08075 [Frateuria edaphi]|uniref:hypothetical protein n=1 Tax=Frateuria edaphi TaxID=2898793 RepID=UPI001E30B54F|nr:hypothetical protein [Frateuria edaphi]UGB47226.1 hypothetical protein LQ772_08075 [Frateuria edaphi]